MEREGMSAIPDRSVQMGAARVSDRRYDCLDNAARLARRYIAGLPDRPVGATAGLEQLRAVLTRPLPDRGEDPRAVIEDLARDVDPGLVASGGPRYFGFVIGGAVPAAVASDWLVSVWDQNAAGFPASPALSVVEEVAATWIRGFLACRRPAELGSSPAARWQTSPAWPPLGTPSCTRPAGTSRRTGCTARPGSAYWPASTLMSPSGSPAGSLGLGQRLDVVPADDQGRMRPDALREALATGDDGPTIVCAQAGEVHTGAFDPFVDIALNLPRAPGVAAHRRCLRTVGRRQSPPARVADRCRAGQLLGH